MKQLLSPKQVARAIGVSESSLKRWCDQGLVPTERTAGGHRRICVGDVVQLIRQGDQTVLRPELLGLPPGTRTGAHNRQRSIETLVDALIAGDAELTRRLVFNNFLGGGTIAELADELFAPAMHRIGDCWKCGDLEVYQEHRACEMLARILHELRTILPQAKGLVALGGTPSGDHYRLATTLVELMLIEAGWRATSLGTSLPFSTLTKAIEKHRPTLFWLSVSHTGDNSHFSHQLNEWLVSVPKSTHVVLGGQALGHIDSIAGDNAQSFHNFASLRQFADRLSEQPAV